MKKEVKYKIKDKELLKKVVDDILTRLDWKGSYMLFPFRETSPKGRKCTEGYAKVEISISFLKK